MVSRTAAVAVERRRQTVFLGLRTAIYPASDVDATKKWFSDLLGIRPYFDEPFYVGFNVAGYELGVVPAADTDGEPITYWGVADAAGAVQQLLDAGASPHGEVTNVGDDILVATVKEPGGNIIGIIENPQFDLKTATLPPKAASTGPGR
jgi:catechol 2,3-dioxygenase-like lactoylglutathione lyase family enzyme